MRLQLFAALTLAAWLALPSGADACSCTEESATDRIASTDRILRVRVLSSTYRGEEEPMLALETKYEVLEALKGDATPRIGVVREPIWGPGTCSLPLIVGHQFILFLGPHTVITICDGSFVYVPGNEPSEQALDALRKELSTP